MRRLIYIPIIHKDTDLGSFKKSLKRQLRKQVGVDNWQKHKEVIKCYWQEIENFWKSKKVSGLKIFQDGLAANGDLGKKIVKKLDEEGSINYKIIKELTEKGAQLVRTEDPNLLKEEYFITKELIKKKSLIGSLFAFLRYKWRKDKLLMKRDAYISKRIDEGLKEGETGICFLGAYHKVLPNLSKDIKVISLKDPEKVKEYYQKFTGQYQKSEVNHLGRYLVKTINIRLGKNYD